VETEFLFFKLFLRYCSFLCADVSLLWTFSVGYSNKQTPKEGSGQAPHGCSPTCFSWDPLSLWRVKGGQGAAGRMGAAGLGGLNECQV